MNMRTQSTDPNAKVALIAGPTASGKSSLAMAVAERVGGIIVNADSAQVYRRFADCYSTAERSRRSRPAPSNCSAISTAPKLCDAARWARDAKTSSRRRIGAGKACADLVGGTGLYQKTLLEGIAPIPEIDPAIREEIRALPVTDAYAKLETEDPVGSGGAQCGRHDARTRARSRSSARRGSRFHDWRNEKTGGIGERNRPLVPLILLPDRDWLYERCDRRFRD